jgi:TP901 family phage tail tape measure protein
MADMNAKLVLELVDKASGKANRIMNGLNGTQRKVQGTQAAMAASANRTAAGMGVMAARLAAIAGAYVGFQSTIGAAMSLETAMADVAKKTDLSAEQLLTMKKRLTDMSRTMPLATTELAELVAMAGQFGIASKDLETFALMAAKQAVAFDMGAGEVATQMSKIRNGFKLTIPELINLGDVINATADSAGTSERDLMTYLQQVAGTANSARIPAETMAAYGATLMEVGMGASKAATTMNAVMAKMAGIGKKKEVVRVLDQIGGEGYSAKLQQKFFDTPVEGMKEFFNVVKKMKIEQRAPFLIEFFGLEYQDEASIIAQQLDTITDRIEKLDDAASYAGSVDKTFGIFSNTTASRLKILGNNFRAFGIMLGETVIPALSELSQSLIDILNPPEGRANIFDALGASFSSFMEGLTGGLGYETGTILERIDQMMKDIFLLPEQGQDLVDRFQGIRTAAEGFGEAIGNGASAVATLAANVQQLIQALHDLNPILGTVAGAAIGLGALYGLRHPFKAVGGIAKAIARVGGKTLGILGAGGAGVATGVSQGMTTASAGAAGASRLGIAGRVGGRLLGAVGVGMSTYDLANRIYGDFFTENGRTKQILAEMYKNLETNAKESPADYMKGFNVLGPAENRITGGGLSQSSFNSRFGAGFDGKSEVDILNTPLSTKAEGVSDVNVTNPMPAPVITNSITVYATTNATPEAIGAEVSEQVGAATSQSLRSTFTDGL